MTDPFTAQYRQLHLALGSLETAKTAMAGLTADTATDPVLDDARKLIEMADQYLLEGIVALNKEFKKGGR